MENPKKETYPAQHQDKQPGKESIMNPRPLFEDPNYKAAGKLLNKVAVITGGDSGIGRAVALTYAKEGADVAIVYKDEHEDAKETEQLICAAGRRCLSISADLRKEQEAARVTEMVIGEFGKVDILVNNAGVQYPQNSISEITQEQLQCTFESNIFSQFYMTKAVLPHMQKGCSIINTTSITAFEGQPTLIDYSATKGAILSFTRSLALSLVAQGIRVNAVAPGPIWTPLIVSSFAESEVKTFGSNTPMARAGQPYELAPAYVFLGCEDSSYISGQVIHVNGAMIIN
ncbi:SDR family oxidoreductase [Clostridium sp. C105KSO13]|uniref:SDR family oxidoreductase n=1 Tax=Clostridium sp. C105KSO13 TaxID=1776045 RepID=UPI0007406947|nr:SDR family oxidoreductase [Clostridium sp. C105KSO13]CUX14047.1 General stress protein 39 [Clostridium sp. C105KSO13]